MESTNRDRDQDACRKCREEFEDAIERLVETGEIATERIVEKPVIQPVDRIITRTTMEPDGHPDWVVLVAWLIGALVGFVVGLLVIGMLTKAR